MTAKERWTGSAATLALRYTRSNADYDALSRAILDLLASESKRAELERDRLWCKALLVLDSRAIEKVTTQFNRMRDST